MVEQVKIDVGVETKAARQSLNRLEKSFESFAQNAESSTDKATSSFDVFKGTIGAAGVIKGLNLVASAATGLFNVFITDGIKAAQVQEDAINSLNIALKASGNFTTEASKDFQSYASSLQAVTKFGDEAILTNAALIQSLGGLDQEGLKGATSAALDLSAALGISLNTAATLVGKAAAGEVGSFSRFGLSVKKGADNAETFANALDQINSKFGGAAAGQVNTFSGASQQLENTFGDLTETFGFFVTQNGLVVGAIKGLNNGIAALDVIIKNNEASIKEFINNALLAMVDAIQPVGGAIVFLNDTFQTLLTVFDIAKVLVNETARGFILMAQSALQAARATAEFLGQDTSGIDSALESVNLLNEAFAETTTEIVTGAAKRIQAQRDFEKAVTTTTGTIANNIRKEIELERNKTEVIVEESEKQKEARLGLGQKEISEEEQVAAKVAEIQKAKSEKKIEILANEQVLLNEMKQVQKDLEAEEALVADEIETGKADARLEALVSGLGKEEAIRSEAEARRLAKEGKVSQARQKRIKADEKAEKGSIFAIKKFEDLTQKEKIATTQSTLNQISGLQKSSNKSLFAVGKAAAISEATIGGILAVQKTLASLPFPANVVAAGLIGVNAALNVSKIASQSPPSFQGGGIVGGAPQDRDNTLANVASGEVILNRRQQANTLFNIANGAGGGGGGGVTVNVEAGVGGISTEQVDFLIDSINDRTEFGNQELRTA